MISRISSQETSYAGRLIAVEGLDGSGKSTQVYLLKRFMELSGLKVFFTEWNSSLIVKKATKKGKKRQLLTPTLVNSPISASITALSTVTLRYGIRHEASRNASGSYLP